MKIQILNHRTGKVIYELDSEINSVKKTLLAGHQEGVSFQNANLNYSNLSCICLDGIRLFGASMMKCDLTMSTFVRANLSHAELYGSKLKCTSFQNTDISHAGLMNCDLYRASLSGTIGDHTIFRGANLNQAFIEKASFIGADFTGCTTDELYFSGAILINSIGMEKYQLGEANVNL